MNFATAIESEEDSQATREVISIQLCPNFRYQKPGFSKTLHIASGVAEDPL